MCYVSLRLFLLGVEDSSASPLFDLRLEASRPTLIPGILVTAVWVSENSSMSELRLSSSCQRTLRTGVAVTSSVSAARFGPVAEPRPSASDGSKLLRRYERSNVGGGSLNGSESKDPCNESMWFAIVRLWKSRRIQHTVVVETWTIEHT